MMRQTARSFFPPQMFPVPRPEAGDVVLGPVDGKPCANGLRVVPKPFEITFGTYDEAVSRAKRFAARQRVDVWVAEGEDDFVLLARHRATF